MVTANATATWISALLIYGVHTKPDGIKFANSIMLDKEKVWIATPTLWNEAMEENGYVWYSE